jgi:DNA-binding NarL/FixJ family response regulator
MARKNLSFQENNRLKIQSLSLTPRQQEVAFWVLEGLCNKQISEELKISIQTVKDHLNEVYKRVGVSSRYELMKKIFEM